MLNRTCKCKEAWHSMGSVGNNEWYCVLCWLSLEYLGAADGEASGCEWAATHPLTTASRSVSIGEHRVPGIMLGILWKKGLCDRANVKSLIKLNGCVCERERTLRAFNMHIESIPESESEGMGGFLMGLLTVSSSWRKDFGRCHCTPRGTVILSCPS